MKSTLKVLRQAGFFKGEYEKLTEDEIIDSIYEKRKAVYSKLFGYEYDPGRKLSDQQIAEQDSTKMLHVDAEAGVHCENSIYIWLIGAFSNLSGRKDLITDIKEEWESETGPIKISFKINGNLKYFEPEYLEDCIDGSFVDKLLEMISEETGELFHVCLGPDLDWFGGDPNYMRLTLEEKKLLEKKLKWKFFDEYLKEVNSDY